MEKRYQIFISSTFTDLKDERQAVLRAVLELDQMPAGMELFPAADASAWQLIKDVIDSSDYYILVMGGRYGSRKMTRGIRVPGSLENRKNPKARTTLHYARCDQDVLVVVEINLVLP